MALGHSNPVIGKHRRAVGVFPDRRIAEQALYELRDSGFPMDRVSVITRESVRDDEIAGADVSDSVQASRAAARVDNKADEGAAIGAATGGTLGGITGLLVGLGTLAIPGIGPIMLAGATATALATTLAGSAIGAAAGSILGALVGLGIPEERAKVYNDRVAHGDYLIIVDGTDEEIAKAERILQPRGIEEYGVYDAPTPITHRDHDADLSRYKHAVGSFSDRRRAEDAIADLRNAGFPLNQISLAGHNFERRESFAGVDLRDRLEAVRYGIPVERAHIYDDRLNRGDYVVMVRGTNDDIRRAATILDRRGIQDWQIYEPTSTNSPTASTARVIEPVSNTPDVSIVDRRNELR